MFNQGQQSILVGGIPTPLKNMTSSVGMMTFPIYGKIIQMFQTTNQHIFLESIFFQSTKGPCFSSFQGNLFDFLGSIQACPSPCRAEDDTVDG